MRSCASHQAGFVRHPLPTAILSGSLSIFLSSPPLVAERNPEQEADVKSPPSQVGIVFMMASPMSPNALVTLKAEAERIWSEYGVRIHWSRPGPEVDPSTNVVVLLSGVSRPCRQGIRERALGCFTNARGGRTLPIIQLFPAHAQRLVHSAAARLCDTCPAGWLEHLYATILGRALAHELGHYFLGPAHSASGLMRESYSPRDLLIADGDAFSLTADEVVMLNRSREADRQR